MSTTFCSCGTKIYRRSASKGSSGLCMACWRESRRRYCIENCGNRISWHSTGRCRPCSQKRLAQNAIEGRRRAAAERRRIADEARVLRNAGNFGVLASDMAAEEARMGSSCLLMSIKRAGLDQPAPVERRPLTLDEQIALIEQGRATVVPVVRVPQRTHSMSLTGCAAALTAGF